MGKIIAVANQKGGVGKTTTSVNLAAALHDAGCRTLLCDLDPQGNATSSYGKDKKKLEISVYDVLVSGFSPIQATVTTKYGDLLPSNTELSGAGIRLVEMNEREYILKKALEQVRCKYDFIIIDCPPSLEMLTLNGLTAADSVLIPVQCEYFALEGLTDLMTTVKLTKRSFNPALEIEGVLLTMFDGRTNLSFQVAEEVKKYFKNKVYGVVIPRNVRLSEAPSHGKPVLAYDGGSKGALAYKRLARELMEKNNVRGGKN